jgi:hypothetical protein
MLGAGTDGASAVAASAGACADVIMDLLGAASPRASEATSAELRMMVREGKLRG